LRRKLLFLNLALLVVAALLGWRLRADWLAAKARADALRKQQTLPLPAPPYTPVPPLQPVMASGYADIAQNNLFSKDRNPTIVIETTPPPPPKPMPALPVLYGVMNLGDGPTAILAEKAGTLHQGVRAGERIGAFKLVSVSTQTIVFDWDGKLVERKVDELVQKSAPPPPEADARAKAAPTQAPPPKPQPQGRAEPGVDIGNGIKACQPGDASPAGTVVQGMRKVVSATPFGESCRWEPVK
jgi:hypothetical protein